MTRQEVSEWLRQGAIQTILNIDEETPGSEKNVRLLYKSDAMLRLADRIEYGEKFEGE